MTLSWVDVAVLDGLVLLMLGLLGMTVGSSFRRAWRQKTEQPTWRGKRAGSRTT